MGGKNKRKSNVNKTPQKGDNDQDDQDVFEVAGNVIQSIAPEKVPMNESPMKAPIFKTLSGIINNKAYVSKKATESHLKDVQSSLDSRQKQLNQYVGQLSEKTANFKELKEKSDELDVKNQEAAKTFNQKKVATSNKVNKVKDTNQNLSQKSQAKDNEVSLLDKEALAKKKQLQDTKNQNYQQQQKKDQEFSIKNDKADKKIQELNDEIEELRKIQLKNNKELILLDESIDISEQERLKAAREVKQLPVETDTAFDPSGLDKATLSQEDLKNKLIDLTKDLQEKNKSHDVLQKEHDINEKELSELLDHSDVDKHSKDERDKKKIDYQLRMENQKNLFDDNVLKLSNINDIEEVIETKEKDIIEKNGIIHILLDQNEYERRCKQLEQKIRDIEDTLNTSQNQSEETHTLIDHILSMGEGDTKVQEQLDALTKLNGDIGNANEQIIKEEKEKDENRKELKQRELLVIGKELQELVPDQLEKQLDNLQGLETAIDTNLVDASAIRGVIDNVKQQVLENMEILKRRYHGEIVGCIEQIRDRNIKVYKRVNVVYSKLDGLDQDVKNKKAGIEDPDKLLMLDKVKRKIVDIRSRGKEIIAKKVKNENDKDNQCIESLKNNIEPSKSPQASYENVVLDYIQELDNNVDDVRDEVIRTEKETDDLEKRTVSLQQELDEFTRMIIDEKVSDTKDILNKKINDLKNIEDDLTKLEQGIKELKNEIKDKEQYVNNPNQQKGLADINKRLGDLEQQANGLRKNKDILSKDINGLKQKLDNTDLDKIKIEDVFKMDKQIEEMNKTHQDIKDGVKDGKDKLKKLNTDWNNLIQRIRGDKRHEAGRKIKQTQNNIEDLQRKIDNIENSFTVIDKNGDFLQNIFADKEKNGEIGNLSNGLGKQNEVLTGLKKQKQQLEKQLKIIEDKFFEQDIDETPIETWIELSKNSEDIASKIEKELENGTQLDTNVDKNKNKSNDMVEKYKVKKDIYKECIVERDSKKSMIEGGKVKLNGINEILNRLENDLQNSPVPETDKENLIILDKLMKEQSRLRKGYQNNTKKLNEIDNKFSGLSTQLDKVDRVVVTNSELQNILDQLKKLGLSDMNIDQVDIKKHAEIVDDFCKQYRGQKLYELDRKIKEAEEMFNQLDKLHIKVVGEVDEFKDVVKKEDNNPEDIRRVNKIQQVNEKTEEFTQSNNKIGKDKKMIKGVLTGIKDKLAQQVSGDITLAEVNDLIKDVGVCNGKIKKNITILTKTEEELNQLKLDFDEFIKQMHELNELIDDLQKLIKEVEDLLEQQGKQLELLLDLLKQLEEVANSMTNNPDYELKKASVDKLQEFLSEIRKSIEKAEKDRTTKEKELKKIKLNRIQSLEKDDLGILLDQVQEIQSFLEEMNLDQFQTDLQARRKKIKDADIDTLKDTKENIAKQLSEQQQQLDEFLNKLIQEAINKLKDSKDKQVIENIQKKGQSLLVQLKEQQEPLEKVFGKLQELSQMIQQADNLTTIQPIELVPFIHLLREIGAILEDIDEAFNSIKEQSEIEYAKLGGLDINEKFAKQIKEINDQSNKIKLLQDQIERLRKLGSNFDTLTSSAEEENFIEELMGELQGMKDKLNECKIETETCSKMVADFKQFSDNLVKDKQALDNDELEQVLKKISHADQQIGKNRDKIDGIENSVNAKRERFGDMELEKKFRRRQREIDELGKHTVDMKKNIDEMGNTVSEDMKKAEGNADGNKDLIVILSSLMDGLKDIMVDLQEIIPLAKEIQQQLDIAKGKVTPNLSIDQKMDLLEDNLDIKRQLRELLKKLNECHIKFKDVKKRFDQHKNSGPKVVYKAAKGDDVDQLLAEWLNTHGMGLRIKRLGGGFYMFGTKKIYAKITNGKLVIRVGGGYMGIDEFMAQYGMQELHKQQRLGIEDDDTDRLSFKELGVEENKDTDLLKGDGRRKTVIGIAQAKKSLISGRKSATDMKSPNGNEGRSATFVAKKKK